MIIFAEVCLEPFTEGVHVCNCRIVPTQFVAKFH